jgi:hypothetical protein
MVMFFNLKLKVMKDPVEESVAIIGGPGSQRNLFELTAPLSALLGAVDLVDFKVSTSDNFRRKAYVVNRDVEVRTKPKIGRNDACNCGSGKKYKHCCLSNP